MARPTIRVVGLGPGDEQWLTLSTVAALDEAPVARLRTSRHPAAARFPDIHSYDEEYERAESFQLLYATIANDLIRLAHEANGEPVVYAVPGSPVVAEHTVELLVADPSVDVILDPAVSVVDVACAALGRDPMAVQLRIVDALAETTAFRGPGPLLVLQTYAPEILATVVDRLPRGTAVTILHHLGLPTQQLLTVPAQELPSFVGADHLTSLWIDELRTAGAASDDLVDLMRHLRQECAWDIEQTHASLTRHLLEEAYEAIDALEAYARALEGDGDVEATALHAEEELGDLLFQIVFHAELGDEEERFNLTSLTDGVRNKLIARHPHVFGDVEVATAEEAASRWEQLKKKEKQRTSVTDGIAWQLPGLVLQAKLLRKARAVGIEIPTGEAAHERLVAAVTRLTVERHESDDAQRSAEPEVLWGEVIAALGELARWNGVDVESVARYEATKLRDHIVANEGLSPEQGSD
ncbi:unannotated protein [freshwater metagenome]|uniref:Unannotated protein n=1 Tax=freshwater metagenome TaxID=449393 RepID=A0A6J7D9E9_9ZZZZ|nr:hypothetical protein [Actinomycetota bacterium]